MQLYKFTLSTWRGTKVLRTVLEVEEKPKTYMTTEKWKTRILKSDVGVVSGYNNGTLYLLENDMEKAKNIFAESLKNKIASEKNKLEYTIKAINERIEEYENSIVELLKGEEK